MIVMKTETYFLFLIFILLPFSSKAEIEELKSDSLFSYESRKSDIPAKQKTAKEKTFVYTESQKSKKIDPNSKLNPVATYLKMIEIADEINSKNDYQVKINLSFKNKNQPENAKTNSPKLSKQKPVISKNRKLELNDTKRVKSFEEFIRTTDKNSHDKPNEFRTVRMISKSQKFALPKQLNKKIHKI